jgi:uncharacterized protein YqeY
MSLKEKINSDLKDAMKSGDKIRLSTVRSIRALILDFEKSGAGRDLTPVEEVAMLTRAAKKRRDSIEQYKKAGRNDLVEQEEKELAILAEYLPKQLSNEELEAEVKKLADDIGATSKSDFPKLMPLAVKTLNGKADGKRIKEAVDKLLS